MSQSPKKYNDKDADYYMHQIPLQVLEKLDKSEREHIKSVIYTALPRSSPKLIDLRFVVDLIFTRYFVVLLIGKDRRKQQREHQVSGISKFANVIAAIILIIAMSLLVSAVTFLILYLIKSALGIDLFKGHLTDILFKS